MFVVHAGRRRAFATLAAITLALWYLSAACQTDGSPPPCQFPTITSFRQLQVFFTRCDKNSLVIFDIDDTLTTASDMFSDLRWNSWFEIRALLNYPKLINADRDTNRRLWSLLFRQIPYRVFDPDITRIIQQLQNQECMVMALTALNCGTFGVINSLAEWRANKLSDLGIHFGSRFDNALFSSLPSRHGTYPCLHRGILLANGVAKGAVLGAFLDRYHLQPRRIIFFDDRTREIASVANECAQRAIPFSGYRIMGATLVKTVNQLNTGRPIPQIEFLTNYARWLKDAAIELFPPSSKPPSPVALDMANVEGVRSTRPLNGWWWHY